MLCESRMAAATKKKDGCGLGVPWRKSALNMISLLDCPHWGNPPPGGKDGWGGVTGTNHAQQSLHAQQIGVAHGELRHHAQRILQVAPGALILLVRDEVAHHAQSMSDGQRNVQTSPPARSIIMIPGVTQVDQAHERRLMEERKHAVEILKVVLE